MKSVRLGLLLIAFCFTAIIADNTVYYSENQPIELTISSSFTTMMAFDVPVFASICHPTQSISFQSIRSLLQPIESESKNNESDPSDYYVARHLKITPHVSSGSRVMCSIKLVTDQIITMKFTLSGGECDPMVNVQRARVSYTDDRSSDPKERLFRQLLETGALSGAVTKTPRQKGIFPVTITSVMADYKVIYVGQLGETVGILLDGSVKKSFMPSRLGVSGVNKLYYSAFVNDQRTFTQVNYYKEGESFTLAVLGRMTLSEIKAVLP